MSATFDVTAYPGPDDVTFAFLGTSAENSTPQTDYRGITLAGSCQRGDRLYTSSCVVTVYDVTAAAVGWYQVRVSNSQGRTLLRLEVTLGGELVECC